MSYTDPVKMAAEAAAKAVLTAKEKKTPDPAASIVGQGGSRDSDQPNSISKPYSFLKVGTALLQARGNPGGGDFSNCKFELEASERLKGMFFDRSGGTSGFTSVIIPTNTAALVQMAENDKDARFARELHERAKGFDANKGDGVGFREKSMNTLTDEDGGILRGPATISDIVDYMRNTLVFAKAGATMLTLPANGLMTLPKQTGTTQSYWEGEAFPVNVATQPKFGKLELALKKQYSRADITNEMSRFSTVDAEAMLRKDMAAQAQRHQDRTMLQGVSAIVASSGAKYPRPLISYGRLPTPLTAWTEGQDFLLQYTASVAGTDGDTLQPEDIARMIAVLPDEVQESDNLKFVGRNDFWAAISNRRADAVSANDGKGMFLFNTFDRGTDYKQVKKLNGYQYIGSSQVSNQRVKGSGTNLTYLLAGDFSNWVIAELPVAEFLANPYSPTAYDNDATSLRMIRFVDGGPRNASSFVLCDQLRVI
jgi:HK97 family phage major capsid protein